MKSINLGEVIKVFTVVQYVHYRFFSDYWDYFINKFQGQLRTNSLMK